MAFDVRRSKFNVRRVACGDQCARSRGALAPSLHGVTTPLHRGRRAPPGPSPAPRLSRLAACRTSAHRATGAFAKPASPCVPDGNRASPQAIGDLSRFAPVRHDFHRSRFACHALFKAAIPVGQRPNPSQPRASPWVPGRKRASPERAEHLCAIGRAALSGLSRSYVWSQGVALGWLGSGLWPTGPRRAHE